MDSKTFRSKYVKRHGESIALTQVTLQRDKGS